MHVQVVGYRKTPAEVWPLVEDTLHALEFILADSGEWAQVRKSMGRADPWRLRFVAVGNENCGDDFVCDPHQQNYYPDNYLSFWKAIKAVYPWMTIISNCDLRPDKIPQVLHQPAMSTSEHLHTCLA